MEKSKPIEVEAEIIEPATSIEVTCTPAVIEDNLAALDERVEKMISIFRGVIIDPDDDEKVSQARKMMADLNDIKKPIEAERKRVKKEYEAPLKAFEERVKAITSKVDAVRGEIKTQVDEADQRFKDNRKSMLEQEYKGIVGDMAMLISFDAIMDPKWLNRSTTKNKATTELEEMAMSAYDGYTTLKKTNLYHKDEVLKKYAECVDVTEALKEEERLNERDREILEFKKRQEEIEAQRAAQTPEKPKEAPEPTTEPEKPAVAEKLPEDAIRSYVMEFAFEASKADMNAAASIFTEAANKVAKDFKGIKITNRTIKCLGGAQ